MLTWKSSNAVNRGNISLLGKPLLLGRGKDKDRPELNISTERKKHLAKQDLISTQSKKSLGCMVRICM